MSDPNLKSTALVQRDPAAVEYVPYGSQDKLKMTVAMVQNLIAIKTKTGKTCSTRDAIRFMALCQAKRLNPFEEDAYLIGYDGKNGAEFSLITAHQTYLKRAELHPEFDGMKSGVIVRDVDGNLKDLEGDFYDDGQDVVGAWASVFFRNRRVPMTKRLSVRQRKPVYDSPFWRPNKVGEQIVKCAEADALRASFPTMLGGLFMREEIEAAPAAAALKPDFTTSSTTALFNGVRQLPPEAPAIEPPASLAGIQQASDEQESRENEQAEAEAGLAPEPAQSSSAAPGKGALAAPVTAKGGFNALKALRGLCKMAAIAEGKFLDHLADVRSTQGDVGSLEEFVTSYPLIAKAACDDWATIAAAIKAQNGGDK